MTHKIFLGKAQPAMQTVLAALRLKFPKVAFSPCGEHITALGEKLPILLIEQVAERAIDSHYDGDEADEHY